MKTYMTTIERRDVGKSFLLRKCECRICCAQRSGGDLIHVGSAIGIVMPRDVGKRVYAVHGVIQVENDEQRDARLQRERQSAE